MKSLEWEAIRDKAFEQLSYAQKIYETTPSRLYRGYGKMLNIRALLRFDVGQDELAETDAKEALSVGKKLNNNFLISDALVVLSAIELSLGAKDLSLKHARDALTYAEKTENPRLETRAHIRIGKALVKLGDFIGAQKSCNKAEEFIAQCNKGDYLWRSFSILKESLPQTLDADPILCSLTESEAKGIGLDTQVLILEEKLVRAEYEKNNGNSEKTRKKMGTYSRKIRITLDTYEITDSILAIFDKGLDADVKDKLGSLKGKKIRGNGTFQSIVERQIGSEQFKEIRGRLMLALYSANIRARESANKRTRHRYRPNKKRRFKR